MEVASDTRVALKRWFQERLTQGERPKEEWRQLWEATWDLLLATPARELIDVNAVEELTERLLDPGLVTDLVRPIVAAVARAVVADLRTDERPIERFLPPEAQEKLRETLARPGLVHPDWVRAMFRGEAAEAVLNDALYRALQDFSTILPRLLVKISPMGRFGVLGGAGAFAEKLIQELERLIEPEIRSFLTDSTGRLLERAAEFTVAKLDDPASIEFRSVFVGFILSKSPAFFLEGADDELIDDVGTVIELSARHAVALPEMRADIHAWIARGTEYASDKTLGEALQLVEGRARPPIDAIAEATWPAFTTVLGSPHAQAWLDLVLDELFDEYERITAS